jgi:hypothetical protein
MVTFLDHQELLKGTMERIYTAPFARADREEDYRIAWAFFEHAGQGEPSA